MPNKLKVSDIEPGMIIEGPGGQTREIISIDEREVVYRQLGRGQRPIYDRRVPDEGTIKTNTLISFKSWAQRDVTETYSPKGIV